MGFLLLSHENVQPATMSPFLFPGGMKVEFTIEGFSQSKLVELGLDATDAILLRYLSDLQSDNSLYTKCVDGKEYFWISPDTISAELPIIGILCKVIFASRMKKYVDCGLMERRTIRRPDEYSFYRFVPEKMVELSLHA